ncbi:isoprenoid biosynthesis glyoxalase ElbB [Lacimicrobium alkaliphilum]|uniref:Glyoxalase n=1 Tax=Lacimicrobium alkaliphilum TaxID=1526571 RepID=A0ABQ1RMT6_9ALTE|nr:isoprenoid biosynthesis glyoxalase ElbB [Lacimicrobium alkaliphilum]GGD71984.1 glyoxalase [Lacimicrobium alkaliphilum]
MKNVAVVLSGCGVFDGAEIYESVLTLLALDTHGAKYQCFAPDMQQYHVINHLTGEEMEGERRNVLVEAARIARGEINKLEDLDVKDFDALLLPGGFGAAKNLSDFALKGSDCTVQPQVERVCKAFAEKGKPAGYLCIAPAMLARIYGRDVKLTIGNDAETAKAITDMGAEHINCAVTDVVEDTDHKLVTSPAYMLAQNIGEAAKGINKLVDKVLGMA